MVGWWLISLQRLIVMHRLSSCSKTNIVLTCACTRAHTHLHILIRKSIFQGILCVSILQKALRKGCRFHGLLSVSAIIKTVCGTVILTLVFGATVNISRRVVAMMTVDMWVNYFRSVLFFLNGPNRTQHVMSEQSLYLISALPNNVGKWVTKKWIERVRNDVLMY